MYPSKGGTPYGQNTYAAQQAYTQQLSAAGYPSGSDAATSQHALAARQALMGVSQEVDYRGQVLQYGGAYAAVYGNAALSSSQQIMDTSSPAVLVNAELLKMYLGRRVRTVVQVMENNGGTIIGQSTDDRQLTIKGAQSSPLSHFVEIIGIADGNQSIRAEICTDFGEKFDAIAYNGLCQLANSKFKNLFL